MLTHESRQFPSWLIFDVSQGMNGFQPVLISLAVIASLTACGEKPVRGFPPRDTSLIAVIAQPEKFEGKKIIVKGYYNVDWEISALYPSYELRISAANGIWLQTRDSKVATEFERKRTTAAIERKTVPHGEWVRVVGTFTAREHGHTDRWPGTLKNIEEISVLDAAHIESKQANKAPEPTATSVTSPAAQEPRQP